MSVRPIVLLGDPRLRLRGETVDSFGKYLHELLDDLTDSMRHAPGVGLAAPQLGEALRACVVEVEGNLYELVNPQIVRAHGDDRELEGCLSLPGYVRQRALVGETIRVVFESGSATWSGEGTLSWHSGVRSHCPLSTNPSNWTADIAWTWLSKTGSSSS